MIELRLIGYTADLGHLVLVDEEGSHPQRYRLVIEPDLFATLDEVRRRRRDADLPVGDMVEFADRFGIDPAALQAALRSDEEPDAAPGEKAGARDEVRADDEEGASDEEVPAEDEVREAVDDEVGGAVDDEVREGDEGQGVRILDRDEAARRREGRREEPGSDQADGAPTGPEEEPLFEERVWGAWSPPEPEPARDGEPASESRDRSLQIPTGQRVDPPRVDSARGLGVEPPAAEQAPPPPDREEEPPPRPTVAAPISDLSPAEIQSRLRAGHSVEEVAEEAGTERSWIESWLTPIEAERSRILNEARAQHLDHTDLGESDDPLGEAVDQNLAHIQVDPESIRWEVARPSKGTWRVLVRYVQGDRERQATWLYDPQEQSLTPASPEAREVGFTRRGDDG